MENLSSALALKLLQRFSSFIRGQKLPNFSQGSLPLIFENCICIRVHVHMSRKRSILFVRHVTPSKEQSCATRVYNGTICKAPHSRWDYTLTKEPFVQSANGPDKGKHSQEVSFGQQTHSHIIAIFYNKFKT